ncbi:ZZ-type domain-containing protein [[Candida] zeylanoides]
MDSSNTKHISLRFMPDDSLCTLNIPAAKLARYINDKPALVKFLNTKSGLKVPNIPDLVIIYRKSKKNKSYVPLETRDDFKSLHRSLEVKNSLKLKINVKEVPQMHTADIHTLNEATVPANIKETKKRRADESFKSLSKSLFFELSETFLQSALERFKEAISEDIVYDIPFGSCSLASKEKLEKSTEIKDAERGNSKSLTTTASTVAEGEGVLIVETVRMSPRCMTLKLNNASSYMILGSQLKFEFFNDSNRVAVSVPSPHDIAPGFTKSFNLRLGSEDPNFPSFEDSRLRIETCDPNVFMEGAFASSTTLVPHTKEPESIKLLSDNLIFSGQVLVSLHIKAKGSAQIVVTNDTEQDIDCSDLTFEIINCFEQSICKLLIHKKHAIFSGRGAKFNLNVSTAHLKYPFKLIMKNETIQGECNLCLKNLSGVFDFELGETAVLNSSSETDDDIYHEETLKTDVVSLATPETVVEVPNDENTDDCPMLVDGPPSQKPPSELSQSIEELRLGKSSYNNSTSVHSMILPTLPQGSVSPKNSTTTLSASVYADANTTLLRDGDEDNHRDDDYDLISTDTGDDFGSDYEVLSRVTSNI